MFEDLSSEAIISIYHKIDKNKRNIKSIFVTFSMFDEKFLNLYAWIFATTKNHQIITRSKL